MKHLILVAALLQLSLASAHAQPNAYMRPRHATLTLAAGHSTWDLSGTGTSILLAARADRPLGVLWLLGEGSLATFRAEEQSGDNTYIIPEIQLQVQIPRAVAPYLGVGAGAIRRVAGPAGRRGDLTTTAAAGLRLWGVMPRGVLRAEFRIRGIGQEFTGSAFEITGGIGWSF